MIPSKPVVHRHCLSLLPGHVLMFYHYLMKYHDQHGYEVLRAFCEFSIHEVSLYIFLLFCKMLAPIKEKGCLAINSPILYVYDDYTDFRGWSYIPKQSIVYFFNCYQVRYCSNHTTDSSVIFFNRAVQFAKSKCYNSLRCDGMRPIGDLVKIILIWYLSLSYIKSETEIRRAATSSARLFQTFNSCDNVDWSI